MVGNDIIDLKFASVNSRWQEQRFLDKLFTLEEQKFILWNNMKFQNIWYLWSMKESVYKIASKTQVVQKFNPKDFQCHMTFTRNNSVRFNDTIFKTSTLIEQDFIYTTASNNKEGLISNWIPFETFDSNLQHLYVTKHGIELYAELKSIPISQISIRKDNFGVPRIYVGDILQKEHISITHHGHYGGFAIAI